MTIKLNYYYIVTRCVAIRFRLCWRHSGDLFVCFGAKPTQRAWGWDLPRDRKWGREGRSQRRQREQMTQQGRREQSACGICSEKDTVGRRRLWVKTVKDELTFLVALWKFRANKCPAIAYKCTESCTKVSHRLPPSCAWSWPESVFVRLFFSSTLSVVFCVPVKKYVMPLVGNH